MKRIIAIVIMVLLSTGWCCPQSLSDAQVDSLVALLHGESDVERRLMLLNKISADCQSVDTTIKYAQMELEEAVEADINKYVVQSMYFLGWSFFQGGDLQKAISIFQEALERVDFDVSGEMVAALHKELAYCYIANGDFENALASCRKAYQQYDFMNMYVMVGECYRMHAIICIEYHFFDYASLYIQKAIDLDTTVNRDVFFEGYVQDLLLKGNVAFVKYKKRDRNRTDLLDSALALYTQCDSLYATMNGDFGLSEIYTRIAELYVEYSKLYRDDEARCQAMADSAISYSRRGIESAQRLGLDDNWLQLYMAETHALIVSGVSDSIGERLSFIDSRYTYKPDHQDYFAEAYYELLLEYCKMSGNYEEALGCISKLQHHLFDRYKYDLATRINNIQAREDFDRQMDECDEETAEDNRRFQFLTDVNKTVQKWLLGLGIFILVMCVVSLIIIVMMQRMNITIAQQTRSIQRQNQDLTHQQQEFALLEAEYTSERSDLDEKKKVFRKVNRQIITSLNHARQMQNMLMPSRNIMQNIFGDCLIYWKPLTAVSGDFYWATQIRDLRVVVVADCTGHGVPGAFMSMLGISSLNYIVSARNVNSGRFSAAFVIDKMRSKVIKSLRQSVEDAEQYDGMDMAVVVTRIGESRIEYAGANCPLLIAGANGVVEYEPDEMSAGLDLCGQVPFTNHIIDCKPGDVVYMYSDGVIDQFGGKNGRTKYGHRRMRELLGSIYSLPFSEQYLRIREADVAWTTIKCPQDGLEEIYTPQLDDQLLIGVRIG